MTVVVDRALPEALAPAAAAAFGADFAWEHAGEFGESFDPVTDVRVRPAGEPMVTVEWIAAVVEHAMAAIEVLQGVDTSDLDPASVAAWAHGVERVRRGADAAAIAVADHVDQAQPFRHDGFFTARRWLTHALQLSGAEAGGRVQAARFGRRVPMWSVAEGAGQIGVAQMGVMSRIAANPRLDDATLRHGAWPLLVDAMDLPFREFEVRARTWESLADPISAESTVKRQLEQRDVTVHVDDDGAVTFQARLDPLAGAEVLNAFAHYVDAEFRVDWREATDRLGRPVTVADLRRRESHRRADALLAMARDAAAARPGVTRPVPTINFLIDVATAEATMTGRAIDPDRYADVTCRTERGHPLPRSRVARAVSWAMVRRVVYDSAGVVTDLGRRSRVFTGAARDAVMLLQPVCIWPGCDLPNSWCHADHTRSWNAGGHTRSDNGGPLCPRHNWLKERGYVVHRDADGRWHVHHPDGHEIL